MARCALLTVMFALVTCHATNLGNLLSNGMLGPLAPCAGDLSSTGSLRSCLIEASSQVQLDAVAECLQAHQESVSAGCVAAFTRFIHDEGQNGNIDHEVADQETQESASQIEAEDQICDARLFQACKTELIAATFFRAGSDAVYRLAACAQSHVQTVGRACAAMAQNAAADGLLVHAQRCGMKALEACPVESMAVSAQVIAGLDSIEVASIASLISCLRTQNALVQQGCRGFVDSVSSVVTAVGDRVSDQFREEQAGVQDPATTPVPAPATTPVPAPATTPSSAPGSAPHGSSDGGGGSPASGNDTPRNPSGNHHQTGPDSSPRRPEDDSSPQSSNGGQHSGGLSGGAVALICILVAVSVVGAAVGGVFWYRRRAMQNGLVMQMGLAQSESSPPQMLTGDDAGGSSGGWFQRKEQQYDKLQMA